ncbi:unnamed protein product [Arctogadus glacialis]
MACYRSCMPDHGAKLFSNPIPFDRPCLHIQMSSPSEPAPAGHQQCVTDRPTGACGGSLLRGFNLAPAGPRVRPPVNAAAAAAIV